MAMCESAKAMFRNDIFSTPLVLPNNDQTERVSFLTPRVDNYSSRFIPKRPDSISRQLFALPEEILASPGDISGCNEEQTNSLIYTTLLEQELLNLDHSHSKKPKNDAKNDFFSQFKPSAYSRNRKLSNKSNKNGNKFFSNRQEIVVNRPKLLDFSEKKTKRSRKGSAMFEEEANYVSGDMQIETSQVFPDVSHFNPLSENLSGNRVIKTIQNMKKISKHPYKVLDAPGLQDDFYQVRFFIQ